MITLNTAACSIPNAEFVADLVWRGPDRIVVQQGRSMKPDPQTGLIPPAPPLTYVEAVLDEAAATVRAQAIRGVFHYLRQADATLIPLPPEAAEVGHKLVPWRLDELGIRAGDAPLLTLRPGDAYVAVTPGAAGLIDGVEIARFIHLRDYFNAQRLAEALAQDIRKGRNNLLAPYTVLVIEAR